MYRYLLFDADQTLLDFKCDMRIAFEKMYTESGLAKAMPLSEELLQCYNACNERWWRKFEQGACSKPELFRGRFLDFFAEAGLPFVEPALLNELYFGALGETGTVYPGVMEMLSGLAEKYEIYIVTNGNAASQRTRLQRSGMMEYVKDYFISETAGAAKPDKKYFDYVLEHIPGSAASDCIVIGDSLTSDMQGAVNAGMDSIWYNPDGIQNSRGVAVTFEVRSFEEIRTILLGNA